MTCVVPLRQVLSARLKALQFLRPEHLDIPAHHRCAHAHTHPPLGAHEQCPVPSGETHALPTARHGVARNEQSWLLAQKELQKINQYKAPRDKLVCLLNCCRVLNNMLNVSVPPGAAPPGADDFLPVLVYVLLRAAPQQLGSNLAYISRFRLAGRLVSETAYFFTNLVSAAVRARLWTPSPAAC